MTTKRSEHRIVVTDLALARVVTAAALLSLASGCDPESDYEPHRLRFAAAMRTLIFEMLASVDDEQRAHLVRRLGEYARDFEELARRT